MIRCDRSAMLAILLPPVLILVARVIFQGLLFTTELSGDEAQYWDWSRHLQLSYYTKGPLIAWIIAASTALFGNAELSVRIGSYLAHAIAGIAVGFLGLQLSGGSRRATWFTAIGFQCVVAFQIAGSLMTVDMAMIAGWSIATSAAVATLQRSRTGKSVLRSLTLCGFALGIAFLAKYTALLGLLGIVIGLWPQRKQWLTAPGARAGLLCATVLFVACLAPVFLWNFERGWPTIQHLVAHLETGTAAENLSSSPGLLMGTLFTYLLQIFTVAGPLLGLAMILGIRQYLREPQLRQHGDLRIALWSALPVLFFYLLVSLKTETEGNWAVGAYSSLVPFAALWLDRHLGRWLGLWIWRLILLRSSLTLVLILTFPYSGSILQSGLQELDIGVSIPVHRVVGHRQFADEVRRRAIEAIGPAGKSAPIICHYYDLTALLAYSLPEKPTVYCASVALGSRRSAYDDFEETRFPQPLHYDVDLILIGADEQRWRKTLDFSRLVSLGSATQRDRSRPIFHGKLRAPITDEER